MKLNEAKHSSKLLPENIDSICREPFLLFVSHDQVARFPLVNAVQLFALSSRCNPTIRFVKETNSGTVVSRLDLMLENSPNVIVLSKKPFPLWTSHPKTALNLAWRLFQLFVMAKGLLVSRSKRWLADIENQICHV